jgi:hypothetical protein
MTLLKRLKALNDKYKAAAKQKSKAEERRNILFYSTKAFLHYRNEGFF